MSLRPLLAAVVVVLVAIPATPAVAAPTLHDLWFQIFWEPQPQSKLTGTCNPDGTSTVQFVIEGFGAGGSGPVRAREEGTIEIGPHELDPVPEDDTHWNGTWFLAAARPLEWRSQFTLELLNGTTVTGTRTGVVAVPYNTGLCREFDGTPHNEAGHRTIGYRKYIRVINLRYDAKLIQGGVTTTETGRSEVNLREAHLDGAPSARVGQYRTTFAAMGEDPIAEPSGIEADETVTTDEESSGFGPGGDGATQADPIEATIEEADEGETTVSEAEATESSVRAHPAATRKRLRLLVQKVRIRTPRRAGTARVSFEIDSTAHRSAGARAIVVRRNGRKLSGCGSGASPCVQSRKASAGDDVTIVVSGRALAGTYTFLAPRR